MKFGILCNGYEFQRWQAESILHLINHGIIPCVLIINDNALPVQSTFQKWSNYPYSKLLARVFFHYLSHPVSKYPVSLHDELKQVPVIKCRTLNKVLGEYFKSADIEAIKAFEPDFLLRFGFDILKGEILKAAHYGVWSYHHDDEQKYRGVPPGFWEIYKSDPVNGAILQRLTETLDGGIILRKGYFGTVNHSWSGNIDKLYFGTTLWPLQVCKDIENGVAEYISYAPSSAKGKLYRMPGNLPMFLFIVRLIANKIRFHLRDLLLCEIWNIAIVKVPIHTFLDSESGWPEPYWLGKNKYGKYKADPFGFLQGRKLFVLFEDYNYREHIGKLSVLQINTPELKASPPKEMLNTGYHLAYPFVFTHNGEWYCMPETANNMSLDLYRFDPNLQSLTYLTTLLTGIAAVDATLCNYNGFWWLFFTQKGSTNDTLYICYSDKLFGPYQPHANNPVKTDICSSRPAGTLFIHEGELYRTAQNCSKTYGGNVNICHITEITPASFKEEIVSFVMPFGRHNWNKGLHTLCSVGEYTLIDGKRHTFIFASFLRQLKQKLLRIVRKNANG